MVEAAGYASLRQRIVEGQPLRLSLEKACTLRGRVVDPQGSPLVGVDVSTIVLKRDRIAHFHTITDQAGRFVWKNAPSGQIELSFGTNDGRWMIKSQTVQASSEEQIITLSPAMSIRGTVVDEETGKAINKFRFFWGFPEGGIGKIVYTPFDGFVKGNAFQVRNNQPFDWKECVRIEAEGYEPVTREFQRAPGEQQFDIRMKKDRGQPENKPGQAGVALPGKAKVQGGGGFHLVRGNTTWIGSEGPPLVYDDYDKHFYLSRGAHTVVLPKHVERFWDFYGQRTLDRGVSRMDVHRVQWRSGQPANIVIPGAIDLPAYQLLLQPSAQRALNLSDAQRDKLRAISAKYWRERRKIAGKELDDMEAAAQRELAEEDARLGREGSVRSGTGPVGDENSPFSKDVVERLERQWTTARKQIEDVLTPEQLRTLKDVTFRTFAFGSGVMFEPEVLDRLGMPKEQQDKLRVLEPELQKEKDRRLRSATREKIKKMLAVLTPGQLAQLREQHSPDKNPDTDCSMSPYPMLPSHMPESGAAEELGFSAEQRDRVRKIVTAHWNTLIALDREKKELPLGDEKGRKAIDEKRRREMADLRKKIEGALTPEQWASCKEMAFENLAIPSLRMASGMAQVPGGMGLTDRLRMGAGMALAFGGLGLTGQQMAELRKIDAEHSDKAEQIYRELTDKALAAFTPAQREKLRAEVDRRGW